jgi:hypothetical protein
VRFHGKDCRTGDNILLALAVFRFSCEVSIRQTTKKGLNHALRNSSCLLEWETKLILRELRCAFLCAVWLLARQAKFQAPHEYFNRGRDLTYPRVKGSPAFRLKGSFQGDGEFSSYQGSYEETWVAPDRWRRQVTIGDKVFVQTRVNDEYYTHSINPSMVEVVRKVVDLFCADFPGYTYGTPDTDWSMAEVEFQKIPVTRVAMSHTDDDGNIHYPRAYYFDQKGLIRARSNVLSWPDSHPETITYDEFAEFAGRQVPRRIDSKLDGVHTFTAQINVLELTQPLPRSSFVLPGIKPNNWGGDIPW